MAARDRCAPIASGRSRRTCGIDVAHTRDEIGEQEALMKSRNTCVVAALCAILTGTTTAAQETCGTREETLATPRDRDLTFVARDLNGNPSVSERVVTHRSGTDDEDEVITETYVPSIEAGRMALNRRVRRVTTRTSDGSRTVEEVERPSQAAPSDPARIVRRTVTTVRQSGTGSLHRAADVRTGPQRPVRARLHGIRAQLQSLRS